MCPILRTTTWLSLRPSTRWLGEHRKRVRGYMDERAACAKLSVERWVFIVAVKSFMIVVNECFKEINGRDTIMVKQNQRLTSLCGEVRIMNGCMRTLSDIDMLSVAEELNIAASQTAEENTDLVPRETVVEFLKDFSLSAENDLIFSHGNVQDSVISTVEEMVLYAYDQLFCFKQNERPTTALPYTSYLPFF